MRTWLAFILGVLVAGTTALGALPTADELLTDITARRVFLSGVESGWEEAGQGLVTERVTYTAPERVSVILKTPDQTSVFLAVGARTTVLIGEAGPETPWPQPFMVFRLLAESDAASLKTLLVSYGVNMNKVTLGRHRGAIVYIIGARSGDLEPSQVWVNRETYRVTRYIQAAGPGSAGYDTELLEYEEREKGVGWPGRLVTRFGSRPALDVRLKELTLNPVTAGGGEEAVVPEKTDEEILAQDPQIGKARRLLERFGRKLAP